MWNAAPRDVLEVHLAEAVAEMQRLSQGAAICTAARGGTPTMERKYVEGRWAALREVRRALGSGQDARSAAHAVGQSWARDLSLQQARGAGLDWVAYRSGGISAVDRWSAEVAFATL